MADPVELLLSEMRRGVAAQERAATAMEQTARELRNTGAPFGRSDSREPDLLPVPLSNDPGSVGLAVQGELANLVGDMPVENAPLVPLSHTPDYGPLPLAPLDVGGELEGTLHPYDLASPIGGEELGAIPIAGDALNPLGLQQEELDWVQELDLIESIGQAIEPIVTALKELRGAMGGGRGGSGPSVDGVATFARGTDENPEKTRLQEVGKDSAPSLFGMAKGLVSNVLLPIRMMTDAFGQVVGTVGQFVSALNPSLMNALNMSLRDMQATAGVALAPLVEAAIAISRSFGATLLPIMERLRPVIAQVAQTLVKMSDSYMGFVANFAKALMPIVQTLAELFAALTPLVSLFYTMSGITVQLVSMALRPLMFWLSTIAKALEAFSPIIEAINLIFAGFSAVVEGVFNWFASLIGIDMKSVFDFLRGALEKLAIQLLVTVARIIGVFGAQQAFIKGVTDAIGGPEKKSNVGLAAAQNAQFGGVASLQQSIMRSALLAGPGGGLESKEDTFRKNVLDALTNISDSPWLIQEKIETLIDQLKEIVEWIKGKKEAADRTELLAADALEKGQLLTNPGVFLYNRLRGGG